MSLSMFRLFKRAFTGEVVHTSEARMSGSRVKIRLRLKREQTTGQMYVMLKISSPGTTIYEHLSADELSEWAEAVRSIEAAMEANSSAYADTA